MISRTFLLAALCPAAAFGQLQVMTSGGFVAAYRDLLPGYQKSSGITVTTTGGASQGSGPNTIGAQLRNGARVYVVIMSKEGLQDLTAEGRILAGSAVDLARVKLGVAVRAGAPKPDLRTLEAYKQMLLRAKSLNIVSTSEIYMREKLLPRLGIAEEVKGKIRDGTVSVVAGGEVEVAIRPVSELLNVPGVDFVGPVPEEAQFVSTFCAAIVSGSERVDAARQLIRYLSSEEAKAAIRKTGMEPLGR